MPDINLNRTDRATQDLLERIVAGEWAPGAMLPNEHELGRQLGVSQGTARKALGDLEQRGILERFQGRGTFVAKTTPERALFRFFRLHHADGIRAKPLLVKGTERIVKRPPSAAELNAMRSVATGEVCGDGDVLQISRVRAINGRRLVGETIILREALFPDLAQRRPFPNALYALFQKEYGISIQTTIEHGSADLVRPNDELEGEVGAAVFVVHRKAIDLVGRVVELRTSRYLLTDGMYYAISQG